MHTLRNILLGFLILVLAAAAAAGGLTVYLYRHPDTVKPVVEKALSGLLNGRATVEALSFGWRPLQFTARGVRLSCRAAEARATADLADVRAEVELTGPFGRRTLAVRTLELSRWHLRLPVDFPVSQAIGAAPSASIPARLARSVVRLLLFREIRLDSVQAAGGEIEVPAPDWRVSVTVKALEKAANGRLRFAGAGRFDAPSRDLSAQASGIRISSIDGVRPGQAVFGMDVVLAQGDLRHGSRESADFGLQARVFYDHGQNRWRLESARLQGSGRITPGGGGGRQELRNIELRSGAGWYDPGRQAGALPEWHLRCDDWLELSGALSYDADHGKGLRLEIADSRIQGAKLLALAALETGIDLRGAALGGDLGLSGSLDGQRQDGMWHWRYAADVRLAGNDVALDANATRVRGRLAGRLGASGTPTELRVTSDLRLSDGFFDHPGARFAPFSLEWSADGVWPELTVSKLDLLVARWVGSGLEDVPGFKDFRLQLRKGRLDAREPSFAFSDGELACGAFGPLSISMSGDMHTQKISVNGREAGLVGFLRAAGRLPAAWKLEGADRLQASATISEGRCRFGAELEVDQLALEVPGDTALGDGIVLRVAADGDFDPARRRLEFSADAHLVAGEGLYRQFYFDFTRQPLDLAMRAAVDLGRKRWQVPDLSLTLKDIVRLQSLGEGGWGGSARDVDLRLSLPRTAVGPLYSHFARDPFGESVPALKRLRVEGFLAADLDLHDGADGRTLRGRLKWSDGKVAADDSGPILSGTTVDFPIWYRSGGAAEGDGTLAGRLTIEQARLPFVGNQAIDWPLQASPNRLDVDAPTRFDFGGGSIELGALHLRDIYAPERLLKSEISVRSVDSARFLRSVWPDAALGQVGGELALTYRNDGLLSRGRISADVFGGRVTVVDPSLTALFTAVPVFGCDVLLEDLLLSELTAGTPFGKIEGVLRGSIRGLEIVDGQPQRFDLLLESEKRKGVPQRISVKAINSISQIGGGQNAFMGLAGSALKLLPGFGYRKIGIQSTLHNDVFTVNGTVRDSGVEYLVRRDGLVGVDVVNRDPNNHIRFTEMLKRIRRAMAPEGKPVVNVNQ